MLTRETHICHAHTHTHTHTHTHSLTHTYTLDTFTSHTSILCSRNILPSSTCPDPSTKQNNLHSHAHSLFLNMSSYSHCSFTHLLGQRGHRVVMVCRNARLGRAAQAIIRRRACGSSSNSSSSGTDGQNDEDGSPNGRGSRIELAVVDL